MKYIIPILLTAITCIATPVTERFMVILIQKDVTIQERRFWVDNMNAQLSTYTTNQDGTITTNYFMKFLDTDNNATAGFTQEPDVSKHTTWSNTVSGKLYQPYIWWGQQVSPKLSKEILKQTEDVIGKNKINIDYTDDIEAWKSQNKWVSVTNGVMP